MNPWLMTVAMVAAWGTFAYSFWSRIALLRALAPEDRGGQWRARLQLLADIGLGQKKLLRRRQERSSGAMHFFIFWGALIVGLRELILMGEGFLHGFQEHLPLLGSQSLLAYLYAFVYSTAETIVLAMVLFALWRRLRLRPRRLDLNWEGVYVLLFIGAMMATDLVFDAARINLVQRFGHDLHLLHSPVWGGEADWASFPALLALLFAPLGEAANAAFYHFGYWGHVVAMLTFVNVLLYTKQAHEIFALPNVWWGSVGRPHAPIALLDVESEQLWEDEALGLARVDQLTWKQGLDLYTCTACGRCYDICPTYVTEKPLTMKWVNDALRVHLEEEAGSIRRTGKASGERALVPDVIRPETLWACTTCRACEAVCPVSIEHVPRIIAMRQAQTLMAEAAPKEMNSAFRGLEQNGNPWNIGYDKRADWAEGLELTVLTEPPAHPVEVLMWVGCMGSFDKRSQSVARATATLLAQAGVSFAILGTQEKCTGDLARRSGNEMLYQMLARENVEVLNATQPQTIVTQCPHCLNSLKNEYPQLEGSYTVFHHSQYLAMLVKEGRLQLAPALEGSVTFHDPCYLGRYNNEYDAPRFLLGESALQAPLEMQRSREESFCCGAGGGRMWMEEKIGRRVNEERVRQAAETGAKTVATACPFCMTMIGDGVRGTGREDDIEVLDIAEIVLRATQGAGPAKGH